MLRRRDEDRPEQVAVHVVVVGQQPGGRVSGQRRVFVGPVLFRVGHRRVVDRADGDRDDGRGAGQVYGVAGGAIIGDGEADGVGPVEIGGGREAERTGGGVEVADR